MASQQAHARTWRITRKVVGMIQLLSHVLALRPQAATTGRAGVGRGLIHSLVAWQVLVQRPAHLLLARSFIGSRHRTLPRPRRRAGLPVIAPAARSGGPVFPTCGQTACGAIWRSAA